MIADVSTERLFRILKGSISIWLVFLPVIQSNAFGAAGVLVYGYRSISRVCNSHAEPFLWLSVGSVAFYLAGTYLALRAFQTNEPTNRIIRTGSGIVAVMLHGAAVIVAIDAATDLSLV